MGVYPNDAIMLCISEFRDKTTACDLGQSDRFASRTAVRMSRNPTSDFLASGRM